MNNFYTLPPLVKYLLKKGTFFARTVCPNHKNFPEDLKVNMKMNVNVLEIGNFRFATSEDLTPVLWRDSRDVYVISSMHNRSVMTVMKRPNGSCEKAPFQSQQQSLTTISSWGGSELSRSTSFILLTH